MRKGFLLPMIVFSAFLFMMCSACAEDTSSYGIVPKLTDAETIDAPVLENDGVYPFYGTVCTNYTYKVTYRDAEGRPPEYVRIWLNGEWHDMSNAGGDYSTGALYVYNYVPYSGTQLFYYFEASNGVGKSRAGIIDSPDQGPVFFSESLENNQIILVDKDGGLVWAHATGSDWVEGVSISESGSTVAAVTEHYIYVFSENGLSWQYCTSCYVPEVMMGAANAVGVSADGNYIAATLGSTLYFFESGSNVSLWSANIQTNSIGLAISEDGGYVAVSAGDMLHFFDRNGTKLWDYQANNPGYDTDGEAYRPAITPDASYIAMSTGCPDRRAYMFSIDGDLIFRSEMLTTDSPVHKSAISDDGGLVAYSADNMDGKEIVFAYDNSGTRLWTYSNPSDSTARAVDVSANGSYVAAGTSKGQVYLLSKDGDLVWKFSDAGDFKQFGEVKFSPDGDYLAAGGTTKKIYMFSVGSNAPLWEHEASTWITKIDFNGEYVVAGTGAREYMFEGASVGSDAVECEEIKQFTDWMSAGASGASGTPVCGNTICEPDMGESESNCPSDCMTGYHVPEDETGQPGDETDQQEENETDDNIPAGLRTCEGIMDAILNFFSSLFGNPICV